MAQDKEPLKYDVHTGAAPKADAVSKDAQIIMPIAHLNKVSHIFEDMIYESPLSGDAVSMGVEDEAPL